MIQHVFNHLPNPALITDLNGRIDYVNLRIGELFPNDLQQIYGINIRELVQNKHKEFDTVIENTSMLTENSQVTHFECLFKVEKQIFPVRMMISLLPNEHTNQLLIQLIKLYSKTELTQKRTFEINMRLRNMVDHMLEGVQILTSNFEYVYLNETAIRHSQMTREDLIGYKIEEKYPGVEDTKLYEIMKECVASQQPQMLENEFQFPDGKIGWFQLSIQPIEDLLFILSVDVTEIKRAKLIVKKQHDEIKHQASEILKFQSQLLSTQINPHFIFNVLNSVQNFMLHHETEHALIFISDFSLLMRSILDNSSKSFISIAETVDFLDLYLKLERQRLNEKFNYSIRISPHIDVDEILLPPMILQPYIENTIIHGVGHLKSGGKIDLEIIQEEHTLICYITDNGIGRKAAGALVEEYGNKKHKSMGLEITQRRLELLGKLNNRDCQVDVDDIMNEDGTCGGTKVILYMPVISRWDNIA